MAAPPPPRNWSQIPSSEYTSPGRRVPNHMGLSSDRQGGLEFMSMFAQRPQYDTPLIPPEFSRPIPFRAPDALQ